MGIHWLNGSFTSGVVVSKCCNLDIKEIREKHSGEVKFQCTECDRICDVSIHTFELILSHKPKKIDETQKLFGSE